MRFYDRELSERLTLLRNVSADLGRYTVSPVEVHCSHEQCTYDAATVGAEVIRGGAAGSRLAGDIEGIVFHGREVAIALDAMVDVYTPWQQRINSARDRLAARHLPVLVVMFAPLAGGRIPLGGRVTVTNDRRPNPHLN